MPETLESRWNAEDAARRAILDRVRTYARLVDASILPRDNHAPDDELSQRFQSICAYGIMNLVSSLLLTTYPPEVPFVRMDLAAKYRHDPNVPADRKQAVMDRLNAYELIFHAAVDAGVPGDERTRGMSFHTGKRRVLKHLLTTGECLHRIRDDLRIVTHRRDRYVTRRDDDGSVLFHIIRQPVDPLLLRIDGVDHETILSRAGLRRSELEGRNDLDRVFSLYTGVEWQPDSRQWLITQEINQKIIQESQEPVSPYICPTYELVDGEHYGRGFMELVVGGDARSCDALTGHGLDFAAACSRIQPVVGIGSELTPNDLMLPNGRVLVGGNVQGGRVMDVAYLAVEKLNDFSVCDAMLTRVERRLSQAMLIESAVQPQQDRVTRAQINRIAKELEGAMGGIHASVSCEDMEPTVRRVRHVLERRRILPTLPPDAAEHRILTGLSALSRGLKIANLSEFVQTAATLSPSALDWLRQDTVLRTLARYFVIDEPGLVKTPQEREAEVRDQLQAQLAAAAAGKTIDVAGNIVESAATAPATAG